MERSELSVCHERSERKDGRKFAVGPGCIYKMAVRINGNHRCFAVSPVLSGLDVIGGNMMRSIKQRFCLVLLTLFLSGVSVYCVFAAEETQLRLIDEADLLTNSEENAAERPAG